MALEKGRVKWSKAEKNFCYLVLEDGRNVFLHRDDYKNEWPPQYYKSVKFKLVHTGHKACPLRAKDAELINFEGWRKPPEVIAAQHEDDDDEE